MKRVAVAWMTTAELQGWIYATRGMGVSSSIASKLNRHKKSTDTKKIIDIDN
jgi:hypothetical protein